MGMDLLKLSKLKLQLRALISETRDLKEKERSATGQVHRLTQKQKQTEEEFSRKLQDVQTELASSLESRIKLESKLKYLESENMLLENKHKELKGTIDSLLQSRESFVSRYEDSTCEMKHSIQIRDRKIAVISEKIQAHLLLFDSIEKEAVSVKQVVDNVQQIVSEKENLVAALKRKMDQVSAIEKELIEKIRFLENKLGCNQDELRRKDKVISELQGDLEAARVSKNCQRQIEELQKAISVKEEVIQNIIGEKKALQFEAWSLESILRKIQDAAMNMNVEDQKIFSSILEEQKGGIMSPNENDRSGVIRQDKEGCLDQDSEAVGNQGLLLCQEHSSIMNTSNEKFKFNSCLSESACSNPQPATAIQVICLHGQKNQLDSESSTAEREPPKDPDLQDIIS